MRRGYLVLFSTLVGCDPTSGLADTADAALPSVKRYFDGAGSRVAEGPWHRVVVDLDADTLYHVGARRLDDDEPTFHLFGNDTREGCSVSPNAGTWLMGKPNAAPFRVLPYLESIDDSGRGRLRFSSLDCEVQDLVVEDAGRPYPRLYDDGYLVPTSQGYTFVNPWTSDTRVIAERLQKTLVWKEAVLLWDDGKLKSYSDQFEAGEELGEGIFNVIELGAKFLVEDAAGLHGIEFDRESLAISRTAVLPGACDLQTSDTVPLDENGGWLVVSMPCDERKPMLVHLDDDFELVGEPVELPAEIDPLYARVLLGGAGEGPGPVATAYLTDPDDDGLGNLWAWQTGAEAPIRIGERGDLDSVSLEATSSEWPGAAQTNYRRVGGLLVHDWLHFRWNGETEAIFESVVRNSVSGEILINFDGVAADLPIVSEDGFSVLENVPPSAAEATSYVGDRRIARIDSFDGATGRVLLGEDGTGPDTWQPLGDDASPDSLRFAWFMPALLFLENWDSERKTGSLVAYNYELDARTTIAEGVSSFDLTSYPWDGVIYAVPYGRSEGLWFSRAK